MYNYINKEVYTYITVISRIFLHISTKRGDGVVHIDELLTANRNNHYKLLTLVGSEEGKKKEIINYLINKDWTVYDVEEVILELSAEIPEEKIGLRIGHCLKDWIKEKETKIVLTNTAILYSPELKQIDPVESFRYRMRGKREAVIFVDGRLRDDKILYSTPDKADFTQVDVSKVVYCRLTEVTTGGGHNEN